MHLFLRRCVLHDAKSGDMNEIFWLSDAQLAYL